MLKRERLVLCAFLPITFFILSACGSPATPGPTFAPTLVYPTRIPVVYPTSASAGTQPTTVAELPSPTDTVAPTLPLPSATATITLIPPSPTALPATATLAQPATAAAAPAGGGAGDPAAGKALFANGFGDPAVPACSTCHNDTSADIKVGPSLMGIGTRGATRVAGEDAATYIKTSIINPNAFIVPNDAGHIYSAAGSSIMYQDFGKHLTDQQINDLVAYLLTLK